MKKIFLGPPGSGKGTAASRIAPKFKIPHISTGELFRENIKNQTQTGIKAEQYIKQGKLVPDEIVIEMLKKRISQDDCENGFILDGFPRTIPQAETLNELTDIDIVINMDVTDDVVIARNSSRVSCSECGKIYNLRTVPPKQGNICDDCGGKVIKRPDDEPEVIKKRLEIYKQQTSPLIDFYRKKGILKDVFCDSIEQTPDETFQAVIRVIEDFLEEKSKEK